MNATNQLTESKNYKKKASKKVVISCFALKLLKCIYNFFKIKALIKKTSLSIKRNNNNNINNNNNNTSNNKLVMIMI